MNQTIPLQHIKYDFELAFTKYGIHTYIHICTEREYNAQILYILTYIYNTQIKVPVYVEYTHAHIVHLCIYHSCTYVCMYIHT